MTLVLHGDCLAVMPTLDVRSVDAIITDLPYGATSNKWDVPLDMAAFWAQCARLLRDPGVVITTATQPFASEIVMSNRTWFKHDWVWIKNAGSNFANTVREPMKEHELVLVFSPGKWTYNKQMQERTGGGLARTKHKVRFDSQSENYREFEGRDPKAIPEQRVPSSWQKFNRERGLHPTQKPVDLFAYLVRTYTNAGDTVLDPCAGSGTTGVAARREGRRFVGIEKDEKYVAVANARLAEESPLFAEGA